MKEITGRHVFATMVLAFGVIIAVNLILAVSAVRTFPGLEVKNSYVASQNFDRDRAAQIALGWTVEASADGKELRLAIRDRDGRPVRPATLDATIGRATHVADDQTPAFDYFGGTYIAPVTLDRGKWELRLAASAEDGTAFRQRIELFVRPAS